MHGGWRGCRHRVQSRRKAAGRGDAHRPGPAPACWPPRAGRPVYVDGGVRTAEHVLAALALGARLVFWAGPCCGLWRVAGADGVRRWLDGLTDDLAHMMALAGAAPIGDLSGLTASPDPGDLDLGLTRRRRRRTRIRLAPRRTYVGVVRATPRARRDRAHLVTEAQRPMSEDIAYRQRRYLIMMGIRVVCFAAALPCSSAGAGGSRRFRQWARSSSPISPSCSPTAAASPAAPGVFAPTSHGCLSAYIPPDAAGGQLRRPAPEADIPGPQPPRSFSQ